MFYNIQFNSWWFQQTYLISTLFFVRTQTSQHSQHTFYYIFQNYTPAKSREIWTRRRWGQDVRTTMNEREIIGRTQMDGWQTVRKAPQKRIQREVDNKKQMCKIERFNARNRRGGASSKQRSHVLVGWHSHLSACYLVSDLMSIWIVCSPPMLYIRFKENTFPYCLFTHYENTLKIS